jgi:hypothetical protein
MLELGESRIRQIAERIGLSPEVTQQVIDRLVALNYAIPNEDGIRYRAAVRALGG